MMLRYLIRCSDTLRLLSWSYDLGRATRCAHSLRSYAIPCYVEVTR